MSEYKIHSSMSPILPPAEKKVRPTVNHNPHIRYPSAFLCPSYVTPLSMHQPSRRSSCVIRLNSQSQYNKDSYCRKIRYFQLIPRRFKNESHMAESNDRDFPSGWLRQFPLDWIKLLLNQPKQNIIISFALRALGYFVHESDRTSTAQTMRLRDGTEIRSIIYDCNVKP